MAKTRRKTRKPGKMSQPRRFQSPEGPPPRKKAVKPQPDKKRKVSVIAGNGIEQIKAFLKEHKPKVQDLTVDEKNLCSQAAERFVDKKWELMLPERKKAFSKLARKYGTCRFKIEKAKITVLNVELSLDRFEKKLRECLRKPSKGPRAQRIVHRTGYITGPGVRYYLPYTPRNNGLQDMDSMSGDWLTDNAIAIKAEPLEGLTYKQIETDIGKFVRKQKRANSWKPARIKGLTLHADNERDEGIPGVHVQAGRTHYLYKARYLDMVFTLYPDAELLLSDEGQLIFQTRSIVAIAMPLREAWGKKKGTFEGLPEGVKELLQKPEKPRVTKSNSKKSVKPAHGRTCRPR